jgi:hypothetical protein
LTFDPGDNIVSGVSFILVLAVVGLTFAGLTDPTRVGNNRQPGAHAGAASV